MSTHNQPKHGQDATLDSLRGAIGHRALWMGLLLQEAQAQGLDWEKLGHAAIFKAGCLHGEEIKRRMAVAGSLPSFGSAFFTDEIKRIFEIEVKRCDEEVLCLEYGHCPLVTAWKRLGLEGEMLAKLCDVAMSGDRGITSRFSQFRFELGETIAQGHDHCVVQFLREK